MYCIGPIAVAGVPSAIVSMAAAKSICEGTETIDAALGSSVAAAFTTANCSAAGATAVEPPEEPPHLVYRTLSESMSAELSDTTKYSRQLPKKGSNTAAQSWSQLSGTFEHGTSATSVA